MAKIFLTDTTLRDGNHSISHQFSPDDVAKVAAGLQNSGVDIIEIGHGDGINGSTINYGFAKYDDLSIIKAAASVLTTSKLAVLLLPGIGTVEMLEEAKHAGAKVVRVATHVTEADVSAQHIRAAKDMGLWTVGFLMMSHMTSVERLVEEAKKMESYGADVVYTTDSAGAMVPDDVKARVSALLNAVKIPVGHHAHNNLGCAIANSLAAVESGATYVDGSLAGLGAGAGNTPTETLIAVLKKMNFDINADLYKAMDASRDVLLPILEEKGLHVSSMNDQIMLGFAGVYSSFLLHSRRAASRFGVDVRDILMELGKRKAVGGQEDWIIEIAHDIANKKI